MPVGPQAYALAITAAGAQLAASGSCGKPLAPNAYAADQTSPAAPAAAAASGLNAGAAAGIYVSSIIVVAAASVFGTYKFIVRRAAISRYEALKSGP